MDTHREELTQRFRELVALEHDAYRLYKALIPLVTEPKDRAILEGIMKDEQQHALYASKIVALLEQA